MDHAAGHTASQLVGRSDASDHDDRDRPGGSGNERPFVERVHARVEATGSVVCLGIDPRPERHPSTHPDSHGGDPAKVARAVVTYFREIVEAAAPHLAAVKLQSAFFERLGIPGLVAMAQLLADVRELGLPAILDAKRGDIGSTAEAYADAYLGHGVFSADALTVQPYLGMDAIEPFVAAAEHRNRGLFVLVRTSNPGGADLQDLALAHATSGVTTVADRLADLLTERARQGVLDARGYAPLGAVVGGTEPTLLRGLRERLPHSLLLIPGYGAQGATAQDVADAFDRDGFGAIVSASRSLTYLEGRDPPAEAARAAKTMQAELRAGIDGRST